MRRGAKLYGFDEHEQPKKVINGPRPSPLLINKDSHKIRKASTIDHEDAKLNKAQPIIIYTHSPKIIHTKAKDFMALVQRLTGRSRTNDDYVSSAASLPQEPSDNFRLSLSDGSNNNTNTETSSALRRGDDSTNVQRGISCLDFADMPLFTPNSSDFFCSSRPVFKYSDSPYGVLGSLISPSALEFIKELPEY
ncbi:hypothetical protein Fmac_023155 [Flemingia macrophylla]|uniref:VQ domain-containing protein n=1 Tax=Flemingia macrophylla TaxID=520843 RepID=A0ABD1LKP7_9FABA